MELIHIIICYILLGLFVTIKSLQNCEWDFKRFTNMHMISIILAPVAFALVLIYYIFAHDWYKD